MWDMRHGNQKLYRSDLRNKDPESLLGVAVFERLHVGSEAAMTGHSEAEVTPPVGLFLRCKSLFHPGVFDKGNVENTHAYAEEAYNHVHESPSCETSDDQATYNINPYSILLYLT